MHTLTTLFLNSTPPTAESLYKNPTFIAAVAAFIIGILNLYIASKRNKQDGIINYRMDWIKFVRNEIAIIIGWDFWVNDPDGNPRLNSFEILRNAVSKVALDMNIKDSYERDIVNLCYKLKKEIEYIYTSTALQKSNNDDETIKTLQIVTKINTPGILIKATETKNMLIKKSRVYLKVEWERVKADSSIFPIKLFFSNYWCPFKGYNIKKALNKFEKEYLPHDVIG